MIWKTQFGTSGQDEAYSVATNSSDDIYIVGSTTGAFGLTNYGGYDAFLSKYSRSGTLGWKRQIGTGADEVARGVITLSSGTAVYSVGGTTGAMSGTNPTGDKDVFGAKYGQ